ncbi:MAG: cation acetate symporter [Planctomycetota bacterium]
MIYEPSFTAVVIFLIVCGVTLGISYYMGRQAKSSAGFFTAHGQIPWLVNGVAFAGDYLSAASFLGICGMIAFYGYDGFLYSIGYLAGWIVALFVVAEPMKRLGKFTFADALDAKFDSKGIKLAAGVSTLVVSVFYLIPQMVGAGVLVKPLLGLEHWVGVVMVGAVVIFIVVTAGMVSTTWVQFLKGALLVVFSTILTAMLLARGFEVKQGGVDGYEFRTLGPLPNGDLTTAIRSLPGGAALELVPHDREWEDRGLHHFSNTTTGEQTVWSTRTTPEGEIYLDEAQAVIESGNQKTVIAGGVGDDAPEGLRPVGTLSKLPNGETEKKPLGLLSFFSTLQESEVILWKSQKIQQSDGATATVYTQNPTPGSRVLRPGEHPRFQGIRSDRLVDKLNFLSLMLALFCGTASLPHILIRYYTVKDEAAARKSTIVGIATIGFFYILTLYMGLGAMTSGALDPTDSNMAAPLLARSMSELMFAIISAIAFTTVLGTVSGLILASAGAVSNDLVANLTGEELTDNERVRIAKIASVAVGVVAVALGILFKELNVSYLVGWAFSIAASANLPALIMLLFWRGTTAQGIIAGVLVGMLSSLGWILLSADTFAKVYGLPAEDALTPFSQPGIVTIPLGFATLIVVSILTADRNTNEAA